MSTEIPKYTFVNPEAAESRPKLDPLGCGNLIRVRPLEELKVSLRKGFVSPREEGKRKNRIVSKGTIWHPTENLYVKFLQLPSQDRQNNFWALHQHFQTFGHLGEETWSIGFGLPPQETVILWIGEPYVGIEQQVAPEAIQFLVIPLVPLLVTRAPHLRMEHNLRDWTKSSKLLVKSTEDCLSLTTLAAG